MDHDTHYFPAFLALTEAGVSLDTATYVAGCIHTGDWDKAVEYLSLKGDLAVFDRIGE